MQSNNGLKILYGKENGDNMADNLTDGLNELAQGFQKRFKVSNKLTIQDMIDLVTPPPHKYLLDPGSFNFSTDWGGTSLTAQNGATMSNNCYVSTSYVDSSNKNLVYSANNQQLTLRLHIWFTSANPGSNFSWGINGYSQKNVTINNIKDETISDYLVAPNSNLGSGNALSFSTTNNLIVNLDRTYVEIIE